MKPWTIDRFLEEGAAMGLAPEATMNLTVRELTAFAKGYKRRSDAGYRRSLWAAWHSGLFARSKRLPDIDKLLKKIGGGQRTVKSNRELLTIAERLNAMFGGRDHRKKDRG